MQNNICHGNYEGSLLTFKLFTQKYPIDSVPLMYRLALFQQKLASLAAGEFFREVRQDDIDTIAATLDKSISITCYLEEYHLGLCYLSLNRPTQSRNRLLSAVSRIRSGNDDNYVFVCHALALTALVEPGKTVKDAMHLLSDCERTYPVNWAALGQQFAQHRGRGIALLLERDFDGAFSNAYEELTNQVLKRGGLPVIMPGAGKKMPTEPPGKKLPPPKC
jgi:hypothetical protein